MNTHKVAQALRSFSSAQWARQALAVRVKGGLCYCALGMLLSRAGVPDADLLRVGSSADLVEEEFSPVLWEEFEIEPIRIPDLMIANDFRVDSHLTLAHVVERGESALVALVDGPASD